MIASRLLGRLLGAVALLAVAAETRAAEEIVLDYQPIEGCPEQAYFVAAVSDRGGRFSGSEAEARARALGVSFEKKGDGFVGSLRVTAPDGTISVREVNDPSCREVVTGLAVVTAIALGANGAQATESRADAEPQTASAPAPERPREPQAPTPPERSLKGTSFGNPEALEVSAGQLRFENDRRYTLGAGADIGLLPGTVLPRLDLSASIASFVVTPPSETSRMVGPILQVRWTWLGPATRRDGDLDTRAYGIGASVNSCSAFTYDTRGFSLLACGEFGVGVLDLETRSDDGTFEREREVGFGTAGLNLDAQYSFGGLVHAGVLVGGRLQFGDLRAEGPGGEELFDAGLWGAYASIGVGLHF